MRRLTLVALFAAACGALPVHAQALSLSYHTGDTYRYSFHSVTKQTIVAAGMTLPADIEITASEVIRVKSVDSAGVSDLTLTLSDVVMKSSAGGAADTAGGIPDITMDVKVAADGRVVSVDGNALAASNPFLALSGTGGGFFITAVLPGGAVKPGDTWSNDYSQANPGGTGSGAIQITSRSKYLRDQSLSGVNAAVVETTSNGSFDFNLGTAPAGTAAGGVAGISMKGTVTSDVTTWVDPSGHRILQSHMTQSNAGTLDLGSSAMFAGLAGPMTIKGTGTTDLTPA
jgi:hypothetical protein